VVSMAAGYLHCSDKVETLLEWFVQVIDKPVTNPLKPILTVVPNWTLSSWLRYQLVARLGVHGNCRFVSPERFVWEIAITLVPELAMDYRYSKGALALAIFKSLPTILNDNRKGVVLPLDLQAASPQLIHQFARVVADLFDQYCIYRPEMIRGWQAESSNWQAELWNKAASNLLGRTPVYLWDTLKTKLESMSGEVEGLPERVICFGVYMLPPIYLELLNALAALTEVHLFVFMPAKKIWEVVTKPFEGNYFTTPPEKIASRIKDQINVQHGFVGSCVELGVEHAALIAYRCGRWVHKERFSEQWPHSLLGEVQRKISEMSTFSGGSHSLVDDSIQIHVCHNRFREIEVLRDHILKWLQEDPDLRLDEIGVFAPDISKYQPYIEALFGEGSDQGGTIPFQIIGGGEGNRSPVIHALEWVLKMLDGRATAGEFIGFLGMEPVRLKFDFSWDDVSTIVQWIIRTNIRWGLDEIHKAQIGFPGHDYNTWRSGLDRLLLGYSVAFNGAFAKIVPGDPIEGDRVELLDKFLAFVNAVAEIIKRAKPEMTVPEWCELVQMVLDRLLVDPDPAGLGIRRIRAAIRQMAEDAEAAQFEDPLPLVNLRETFLLTLSDPYETRVGHPAGVLFGSFKWTHTVPMKIICLIGLNDKEFPRIEEHLTFDLMSKHRQVGDRSVAAEDRYVFLGAILNARQRLYLSYVGKSIRDNSDVPPSPLLQQFMDFICESFNVPLDALVRRHRLHGFCHVYFDGRDDRYFSFSRSNYSAASAQPDRSAGLAKTWSRQRQIRVPKSVSVDNLVKFFQNPAKVFLQDTFGISLPPEPVEILESECFWPEPLVGYEIRKAIFDGIIEGQDMDTVAERLYGSGLVPKTNAGKVVIESERTKVEPIVERVKSKFPDSVRASKEFIDFEINGWRITGEVGPLLGDRIVLGRVGRIRAKDLLEAWIKHLVLVCGKGGIGGATLLGLEGNKISTITLNLPESPQAVLHELLEIYAVGMTRPIPFFPETSFTYTEHLIKGSEDGLQALEKARKKAMDVWLGGEEERQIAESDDPYFDLCFADFALPNEDFESLAIRIYKPLLESWQKLDG